ncbi:hypothetical protein BCR32DRAFT_271358 [Anaeromyces robustus]|uniref:PPM-type phosphatase domain-containing protein n=1 Tax=Anaeromyces robustus TaxID=1754192 RepID=A0A1Y1WS92_9FUNG|nr:hypothetical protein BCR32DRAFT_271358 [Anaeromyces robustus]|eukprot:ORX76322.1 hypothetical protein BCR32DRAFT_271358 [Anaeromyces robustus]
MKTRQNSLYRCQSICKGSGYFSGSKEDRIIVIHDLIEYINENYDSYSKNVYDEDILYTKEELLSVFDGHCGNFCSTYLQQMFPFELCFNKSFKLGNYNLALLETYDILHKKLLKCKEYKPEEQTYTYCSGSTASVALVTEEETFFSFLGDSPILIWKNNEDKPKMLFQEHNIENTSLHQHLIESNIFLVVSQPQNHKSLSKIITEVEEKQKILDKFDTNSSPRKHHKNQRSNKSKNKKNDLKPENVRIGFSALNVWGTLGDSIYEPDIFNTFIEEIENFKLLRRDRLNQLTLKLKSNSMINSAFYQLSKNSQNSQNSNENNNSLKNNEKNNIFLDEENADSMRQVISNSNNSNINFQFDFEKNPNITLKELHNLANQINYEEIIPFLTSRPNWPKISKHISLSKKNLSNSRLISSSINLLTTQHKINSCSLKRKPEITTIKNSELKLFIIASDGVIRSYYEYKDQYNSIITNNYKNPERLLSAFKEFSSSINDDHSLICLFYNK